MSIYAYKMVSVNGFSIALHQDEQVLLSVTLFFCKTVGSRKGHYVISVTFL